MISTTTTREQPSATKSEALYKRAWPDRVTVDISLLLKSKEDEEPLSTASTTGPPSPASITSRSAPTPVSLTGSAPSLVSPTTAGSSVPSKRHARPSEHSSESPAKRQSKWSPEEDAKIIQLRGDGMKWEDISKHLPGRSAISCRLHYQNYLERRSEWDEDRKNKLARLYERFKSDMWAKIAEEMAIPWRAAEAMHWQMGEHEMARRAGVTPFSITTFHSNANHAHGTPGARPVHIRSNSTTSAQMRRDAAPRMVQMPSQQLPSLAELTAGLPAYSPHTNMGAATPNGRLRTNHGARTPPHLYQHSSSSQSSTNMSHLSSMSSHSYQDGTSPC